MLYREWSDNERGGAILQQLVASSELRKQILELFHGSRISGHLGISRTVSNVRRRFYWPGYKKDVQKWCERCDACARIMPGPHHSRAPLHQDIAAMPLERVAFDLIGPFPKTNRSNLYILVIADYFTK